MRVASRTMGPSPLPGPIQNEDGIPDPLAVPHSWFYTNRRWYTGVWVKGRDHPIPEHPNPEPDHGAIPFYLVLSKALMLQKPASSGFPPCWVLYKGRVASRIMGPSPLSGPIQNEGGIPVQGATTPICFHQKRRWHPGPWAIPPTWFYPK